MSRLTLFALTLALLVRSAPAGAEPVALVGGRVETAIGPALDKGTVLMDKGQIVEVGPDVAIPPGSRIIDVSGRIVTPGLVAADTQIGLLEIDLEPSSNDAEPALKSPIRAKVRADDAFDLASTLVAVARRHGVTSVVSAPSGGLVSGQAGWFDLLEARDPEAASAFVGVVSLHARLGEAGAQAVGGSRAVALAQLREYFDDVLTYRTNGDVRRGLRKLSAGRLDLDAGVPVLLRKVPLVVEVHRAADIRAVLRLASELRINVVLLGAAEGWLVADAIAAAQVPVIVDPFRNLPVRFEARNARVDNAALLARSGVSVVIAHGASHNAGNLRFAVGNAIRAGFPRALALRSVTSVAARAFGMERSVGHLEKGARANVVVWTGDPFETSSHAEMVFVRGRAQSVESRQTRLAKRYLRRLGLER